MENNEKSTQATVKFIKKLQLDVEILDLYKKVREKLKEEQYKEDELESIDNMSSELWDLRLELIKKLNSMTVTVKKYGLDDKPIGDYFEKKFKQIDKEIPLD